MSVADEIDAYLDFLRTRGALRGKIVLKPHPRDSREKIAGLVDRLRPHFREVRVLDDEHLFYVPFEILLFAAFADDAFHISRPIRLVCFSSSCLGPAFLFDLRAEIGFGKELVERAFKPALRENRLRHERDLTAALDSLGNLHPPMIQSGPLS